MPYEKTTSCFLLLPLYSLAQLEAGINTGISRFHIVAYNGVGFAVSEPKTSSVYDASLSYKLRSIKLGIGYNSTTFSFNRPTEYYARPMSDIYVFADYEWRIFVSFIYLGINAGVTSIKNSSLYTDASGAGVSYGAHIGYTYPIYKGICVNAQLGFIYAKNTFQEGSKQQGYAPPSIGSTLVTYPFTLGIHYKIHFLKHKKPGLVK